MGGTAGTFLSCFSKKFSQVSVRCLQEPAADCSRPAHGGCPCATGCATGIPTICWNGCNRWYVGQRRGTVSQCCGCFCSDLLSPQLYVSLNGQSWRCDLSHFTCSTGKADAKLWRRFLCSEQRYTCKELFVWLTGGGSLRVRWIDLWTVWGFHRLQQETRELAWPLAFSSLICNLGQLNHLLGKVEVEIEAENKRSNYFCETREEWIHGTDLSSHIQVHL